MLRLGLIGCGNVTENRHLPALKQIDGIEVVAVADTARDRRDKVADRFHIEKRFRELGSLVDDQDIDAIGVLTPVRFHCDMALKVLSAGKHLFLEKPLAMRLDEADQIFEKAAQARCTMMIGFNLRWHPFVRRIRQVVKSGSLGAIEMALSVSTTGTRNNPKAPAWMNRRESGGGVLFEYSGHYFDLWRYLLGEDVEEVSAVSRCDGWDDVSATINMRMTNGIPVACALSESTITNKEIQIYGEKGSLNVSLYRFDGFRITPKSNPPGGIPGRLREIVNTIRKVPTARLYRRWGGIHNSSFAEEWRHFADCIEKNIKPECTAEDGRKALQATLAALESTRTGKAVRVTSAG